MTTATAVPITDEQRRAEAKAANLALKITPASVAEKLGLTLLPAQGWGGTERGEVLVDDPDNGVHAEKVDFEAFIPYSRGYGYGYGNDSRNYYRCEVRVNGTRFRRSKKNGGDFDWVAIREAFRRAANNAMHARNANNEHARVRALNKPAVEALLKEFPFLSQYEINPSRSEVDRVELSVRIGSVSPAVARIILTALKYHEK